MVKVGLPLSLIGSLVAYAMIHVTGGLSWTFDIYNSCPDYLDSDAPCNVGSSVMINETNPLNLTTKP